MLGSYTLPSLTASQLSSNRFNPDHHLNKLEMTIKLKFVRDLLTYGCPVLILQRN
jgi:hypothetical protein